jgi:predicted SAM-dependent methyltransferase
MHKITNQRWERDEDVYNYLCDLVQDKDLVVDVGCGVKYFEPAHELIDFVPLNVNKKVHNLDVSNERFPYDDKEVDFLYCRHTLEDVSNPRWLIKEINRVAKAGYIETPSPLIECARGADAGSPSWRGYYHHRSIVWSDGNKLTVVPKYPVIEHIAFDDESLVTILHSGNTYWNTYYLWENEVKADFSFGWGNPHDYDILGGYGPLLQKAMAISAEHTQKFLTSIKEK